MEPKYYQGMLRKHRQLQAQLDRLLEDDAHTAAIREALNDPAIHNNTRPKKASAEMTLLWELRQTSDMLDIAEQALNVPLEQHQISLWERFVAALRSMFSIEQNPADRPVEELRGLLEDSLVEAEKAAAEPGSRLDYSPTEFCTDPKIIYNDQINTENNSLKIRVFLDRNRKDLSSSSVAHLEHRIKACQKIEKLEKNTTYHPPKTTFTATRDGKPVEEGDLQPGDKIMLNGVHERRSQNTLNGCWSVSFCSQLEYRGVNLTQEDIRAYRPNTQESENCHGMDTADVFSRNKKQTVSAYFALAARTMPNAVGQHYSCMKVDDNALEDVRRVITYALTKDNSPLCFCAKGHYRTIVGIEGDRVYFKNPLRIVGQPESIDSMTLQEMKKLGNAGEGLELSWFKDIKPTLSGGIQPDAQLGVNGISYIGGQVNLPALNKNARTDTVQMIYDGVLHYRDLEGNNPRQILTHFFLASKLGYNRLPGGNYNADALDSMMQTLSAIPEGKENNMVAGIFEHVKGLKNGIYQDDPTAGMLELARKYQSAVSELEENSPLKQTLMEQLTEIRDAVVETVRGRYQTKMGNPENAIGRDIYFKEPKTKEEKALYDKRRERFEGMNEGMAGMLYVHTVVRQTNPMDSQWIDGLQSENVTKGVQTIQKDTAFEKMFKKLYNDANKYQYFVEDLVSARNNLETKEEKAAEAERKAREEAAKQGDKKAEKAKLKAQIQNPNNKEKTPEELREEANEARRWLTEVEKRDPAKRKEFLDELGLDEQLHLNPFTENRKGVRRHHPDAYRERNEVLKIDTLRLALHTGDATELYARYMKEKHKVIAEQNKKDPEVSNKSQVLETEKMQKSTVILGSKNGS